MRLENHHTGEILQIRRGQRKGQPVLELSGTLPPHREGPPMHIHYLEDEEGTVTRGRLSVMLGGKRIDAGLGETLLLPRGIPHRWWNDGDEPLAFEGVTYPVAGLDAYLQAIFEIVNAGPPGRPSLFYMAHVAHRHRRTQVVLFMPPLLQRFLLPVVVAIGTVLGRYRGTDWPGCPARCTGAMSLRGGEAAEATP